MKRDPHLPSAEVCDWLLSQEWSTPVTVHIGSDHGKSEIYDCCEARAAVGADEYIDLHLPAFGLQLLRNDAVARKAGEYETGESFASQADSTDQEQQLVIDINEVIRSSNVSATAGVGACAMVAIALTSQVYDLAIQEDKA
ncbi:hypothetical protein UFOVP431_109 [uncultured Caudovirales phage]|uniref:Uncharacterized protein n=1 Tax=uncultured Caudovirales phage TaxID=2100421 RepID=A0A6J5MT35_9CAUD|nr:hypothetical protein UFOVP431_109 [uncultured Caudovirales phage]